MMKRDLEFTKQDFQQISKLVYDAMGIVLGDHKHDMVYRRLSKRVNELNLSSFREYINFVESQPEEISMIANAITTNLTSFFREGHHFETLEKLVLEHINSNKKSLRIWSAGCSNGAEPHTIAMVVREALKERKGYDVKILATDLDTNMLDFGSKGEYEIDWAEKIPARYKKYIKAGDQTFEAVESIKELIHFKRLNLLEPWPMSKKFDVIFCRNVVIYFDKPTQKVLFNRYADMMNPDGYLFIGHSENITSLTDRFELLGKTTYKRVK